jgi:hypothetical protein
VHGGARIVPEARERQLLGANASAERRRRLVDLDVETGLRKRDRSRKSVRAGADNDGAFYRRLLRGKIRVWSCTRPSGARTRTRYASG